MTKKDRIMAIMEWEGITFPRLKFDKEGNITKRIIIEGESFDSELIFENEAFLKYIIIQ